MRTTLTQLAACVVVMLLAQPLGAEEEDQKPSRDGAKLFERLDANGDGQLTGDEVPEERQRLFKRLVANSDKDADGRLTREEFVAGIESSRPKRPFEQAETGGDTPKGPPLEPEALFERMDQNGDGKVVTDEVPEPRRERFAKLLERADQDDDGSLSLEEFRRGFRAMAERLAPNGRPPVGVPGTEGPFTPAVIRVLDTDGDGTLSREEIAAASQSLAKLDRDGDGTIDGGELFPGRPGGPDRRPGRADVPRPGRPDASRPGGQVLGRLLEADADGDGKLSQSEAPRRLQKRFSEIDTNSDGYVDGDEMREHLAEMLKNRPENGQKKAGGKKRNKGESTAPSTDDAPKRGDNAGV